MAPCTRLVGVKLLCSADTKDGTEKDEKETKTVKRKKTDVLFYLFFGYNSVLLLLRPKRITVAPVVLQELLVQFWEVCSRLVRLALRRSCVL